MNFKFYVTNMQGFLKQQTLTHKWKIDMEKKGFYINATSSAPKIQNTDNIKMSALKSKLKRGKKLSTQEMKFLRDKYPEVHKQAVAAEKEREEYQKEVKNCKTKDGISKVYTQKLNTVLDKVKSGQMDLETAQIVTAALTDEHHSVISSTQYQKMKWQYEIDRDKTNKDFAQIHNSIQKSEKKAEEKIREQAVENSQKEAENQGEKAVEDGHKAPLEQENEAYQALMDYFNTASRKRSCAVNSMVYTKITSEAAPVIKEDTLREAAGTASAMEFQTASAGYKSTANITYGELSASNTSPSASGGTQGKSKSVLSRRV